MYNKYYKKKFIYLTVVVTAKLLHYLYQYRARQKPLDIGMKFSPSHALILY